MPWSTTELARLAGTTVNTVRHYHRLGLLAEPQREDNGYKQYGVRDLVCLLRIRRLSDLGVPLSQIGEVTSGGETAPDALRELDAELASQVARLEQARADIAAILRESSPADTPSGFEAVAANLSESDSSILHIYSRLYDEDVMADLRRMVEDDAKDPVTIELDNLPADADEHTRQSLAERYAPNLAQNLARYPWLNDPASRLMKGRGASTETFVEAVVELYNPAQLDVFGRAGVLARAQVAAAAPAAPNATG